MTRYAIMIQKYTRSRHEFTILTYALSRCLINEFHLSRVQVSRSSIYSPANKFPRLWPEAIYACLLRDYLLVSLSYNSSSWFMPSFFSIYTPANLIYRPFPLEFGSSVCRSSFLPVYLSACSFVHSRYLRLCFSGFVVIELSTRQPDFLSLPVRVTPRFQDEQLCLLLVIYAIIVFTRIKLISRWLIRFPTNFCVEK